MKANAIALLLLISATLYAFRVTEDHGYGVKTYRDSQGRRGVSVDGGNTWFKTEGRRPGAQNSYASDSFTEIDDRISELVSSGKVWVVKSAYATSVSGKVVNLSAKTETGQMQVNWEKQSMYVYLKSLKGVKYRRSGDPGQEGEESRVYKIKGKAIIGKPGKLSIPEKWENMTGGYLYEVSDYISNNPLVQGPRNQ